LQRRTLSLSFQHQAGPRAPSLYRTQNRPQERHREHRFLCMHCLVDGRRLKDREMLQMRRRLEGDLLHISQWPPRGFQSRIPSRKGQYMSSEDGHHLRDEAGSLLAAFELGGAEELTVTSGGTAIAALVWGQSHTSSKMTSSSRACASCNRCSQMQEVKLVLHAPSLLSNLRAPLATLCATLDSTWAEPRKRRCAPPINAHLPPPTYNPSTYIIPHYTHFLIISRHTLQNYSNTQYTLSGRHYLNNLQRHWPHIDVDIRLCPVSFVLRPLVAGSVNCSNS